MTELMLLKIFLAWAFVLAPVMTKTFFLKDAKIYSVAHRASLIGLLLGAGLNFNGLAIVWPLFCIFGFLFYLKGERGHLLSKGGLVACIPFVFSVISSFWFVAGIFDLRLLGYDPTWSFYAALHAAFFGWLFIGCLAFLARRSGASPVYLGGCYLCFVFFLLVAFGIDGILPSKRVGVIGISLLAPSLIGHHALSSRGKSKQSLYWGALSVAAILVSMTLAMLNEFWPVLPKVVAGIPVMVMAHGAINALVAVPSFFMAARHPSSVMDGPKRVRISFYTSEGEMMVSRGDKN